MSGNGFHFALVGRDISYTKSPDIFAAIFEQIGVDGEYDVVDVAPRNLESDVKQLVLDGVRGFSVTIPYKQAVIDFLDDIGPVARALNAANSICVDESGLYGYNTDTYGFSLPLKEHAEMLKGKSALVLGCGGAARAVIYSLHRDFDIRDITVAGRTPEKLQVCKDSLEQNIDRLNLDTITFDAIAKRSTTGWGIIVNATPLGNPAHLDESPLPDKFTFANTHVYYDLNYNHDNPLPRTAADQGVTAIDGRAMLVGQALKSFDIWSGVEVPFKPVFERVFGD